MCKINIEHKMLDAINRRLYSMINKFQNKYRVPSVRLQKWDYANNGAYFITICTKNREHYLGKIENNEMQLSEIGKLAEKFWLEISSQFGFIE